MAKPKKYTPYMLVSYIKRPASGQNTSARNWGERGEWAVEEIVTFVEELRDKHVLNNHVVIDVIGGKTMYSSFQDADKEEVYRHFIEKYRENVQEAITVWAKRQADRGVA